MRYTAATAIALCLSALAGCQKTPQEQRAEQVEAAAENQAEAIAQNAEGAPEPIQKEAERNAEVALEAAEVRAQAIRDSEGKLPE